MTSCGRGRPGHQSPGSTCQITFTEMPVAAMDSMITQGIVNKPPMAVTARIEYQGVCVGQAVTAAMDMANPNAKTIPYYVCGQPLLIISLTKASNYLPTTQELPCIAASFEYDHPRSQCRWTGA